MKTATISKLKASLSEYLGTVKAGEEVIVTDRGRPVARIVPIQHDATEVPSHLLAMERAGLVRIGNGVIPDGFWRQQRPRDKEGKALAGLLREWEEGDDISSDSNIL